MDEVYTVDIIPLILKKFKAEKIIMSGITDDKLIDLLLNYDGEVSQINPQEYPLDSLPNFRNYDAIFIDDDSNWYTIFNELKIINRTNKQFPLVFICNNKFPNKTRDSYLNPDNIPEEFRQKYSEKLPICHDGKEIIINDGFYHAVEEGTSKNGVLTGINDFLSENTQIGKMNIRFIEDITILYLKQQVNQKRIESVLKNSGNETSVEIDISDKIRENQLLISHIDKYNLYNEKFNEIEVEMAKNNCILHDFKNEIQSKNNELEYNESHINNIESKLNLKESQLQNIESKLINEKQENINLKSQLENTEDDLKNTLDVIEQQKIDLNNLKQTKNELINKIDNYRLKENEYSSRINELNNEITKKENYYNQTLSNKNNEINSLKGNIAQKESTFNEKEMEYRKQLDNKNSNIRQKENELENKQNQLDSLEHRYTKQLSKIDNEEYCISCFKDELSNNHLEIEYLKCNNLIKKILIPFIYLYLILNSKPRELSLNLNLYRTLKDSKCFNTGFYLNNNKDLIESKWYKYFSLELHYVCKGFYEKREFNKKYFNRNSKKELLEYLQNCEK